MQNNHAALNNLSPEQRALVLERLRQRQRESAGKTYPMSSAQQRLWFLSELQENKAYNIASALDLTGELDVEHLRRCLAQLVARHEVLRTTFELDGDRLVQRVHAQMAVPLALADHGQDASQADGGARTDALLRREAGHIFDLRTGPLMRVLLVRESAGRHVLCVVVHHIVADGWSLGILIEELAQLAQGVSLAPPARQFGEYVLDRQSRPVQAAALAYWTDRLAGELPLLNLPLDHVRPAVQTYAGATRTLVLDQAVTARLRQGCAAAGVTPFMLLLGAFKVTLAAYSGQQDVLVGTPALNRVDPAWRAVPGYFANAVVLRSQLAPDLTVSGLLAQLKHTVLEALAHQDVPFDAVLDALPGQRDLSHSPLFQAMFAYQVTPLERFPLGTASAQPRALDNGSAKFDLQLLVFEEGQQLRCVFEYNVDLFEDATIARLAGHVGHVLDAMLTLPEARLQDISLLTEHDRAELQAWNSTVRVYDQPHLLHQLVERQAARTPDAVAVLFEGQSLSYAELNRRANRVARELIGCGVGADQPVAVLMQRSQWLPVALLGVLKAGGAYVPLDTGYPSQRLDYMLRDCGARVLLTDAPSGNLAPLPPAAAVLTRLCVAELDDGADSANPDVALRAEQLAYVIYTSGSTGQPKGVMNTHGGVCNRLSWMQEAYRLEACDRVLQKTPISFDVSVWEFFWPLISGAGLVMARPEGHKDPAYLCAEIERAAVTVVHFVPSMLRAWLRDLPHRACPTLRDVMCSGEALPLDLAQDFHARVGARLHNLYGPTEAAIDVTYWEFRRDDSGASVPIGRPIANTEIHIVDRALRPLPPGIPGELLIGGAGVARGYLGQPGLSEQKFIASPFRPGARLYRSGDLARWRCDGVLEFLGRLDDQVKIRGFRIELDEINAALKALLQVRDAAVVARVTNGAARLVAYVVGDPRDAVELGAQLARTLPDYMVPQQVVFLDALPLGPNGKLDRKALPEPDREALRLAYAAPRTDAEHVLARIWSDVLGVPKVGIDDGYFALGGDSIRSLSVIAHAQRQGRALSLQQLFQFPTIRLLSANLQEAGATAPPSAPFSLLPPGSLDALPAGLEDAYPLSTLQAGLVFQTTLNPGSALYHDIMLYRIAGRFDEAAFRAALAAMAQRHPILRTGFDLAAQPEPLQLVHAHGALPLQVHDLRSLDADARAGRLAADLAREKAWRFAWNEAPLARCIVHLLEHDVYQFTFSFHDALLDGWSVNAFNSELFQLYQDRLSGKAASVRAAPNPPYRDYVAAERRALAAPDSAAFWDARLAGAEATLLPRWDAPAAAGPAVRYRAVPLSAAQADGLRKLADGIGVPLKSVLLALHMKALSVLTNQQDVCSGLEHNGRLEQAQSQEVLGLFLNTLPFRLQLERGSWRELIRQVFQAEIDLLPHRRYPMARMQQRRKAALPFEVVFNYTHFHVAENLFDLDVGRLLERSAVLETEYPLRAEFNQRIDGGGLTLDLHYDAGQVGERQIAQIAAVYGEVLVALLAGPDQAHGVRALVPPLELQQLREWNRTQRDFPLDQTFCQLFERQVARTPHRIAVRCGGRVLSYAQLNQQANRLAHCLIGHGIGPETLVPLLMERSESFLVAMLAVFKTGAAYLPLDPQHPERRLWQVLEPVQAPLMLTHSAFGAVLSRVSQLGLTVDPRKLMLDRLDLCGQPDTDPAPAGRPEHLAYVIYTSGSTGAPKGAMVRQNGMINHLYAKVEALALGQDDVVAQTAPQCFDISVWQFLIALLHGGCTVVYPDRVALDPLGLLQQVEHDQVTILETVPSLLRATTELLALQRAPALARLRWLLVTGEALQPDLCGRWFQYYPAIALLNAYGPTECSDDVAHHPIHAPLPSHVQITPIGRAVPNMQLHVVNQDLLTVPIGTPGELVVGGVGVGRGYFRDEERTRAVFLPDPFAPGGTLYKTGDLARFNGDGTLTFLGRLDHQVKLRGFRIELGEVEAVLLDHPAVRECVVVAHEQKLVAYVVLASPTPAQELRRHVARHLPEYMVPALFMELDAVPVNANGKYDRKQLPAPLAPAVQPAMAAPASANEHLLHDLWCRALQVERVGVESSFFEVGGHSLLLIQLHAQAQIALERELPMTAFFEYPTIRSFGAYLEQGAGREKEATAAAAGYGQQRRQAMQRRTVRRPG